MPLKQFGRGRRTAPSPVLVAGPYATLGDRDAAFRWLEREPWVGQSKAALWMHAGLVPLRCDPRFGRVSERLGLAR